MIPDALTRTGADAALIEDALRHGALIRRLERLADLTYHDIPDGCVLYDEQVGPASGELAVLRYRGLWRYAVVDRVDDRRAAARCVCLSSSALDRAQRTWTARSRTLLSPDYTARLPRSSSKFKQAVFEIAIATTCARRPWAAVVPPHYLARKRPDLLRAPDQTLGEEESFPSVG